MLLREVWQMSTAKRSSTSLGGHPLFPTVFLSGQLHKSPLCSFCAHSLLLLGMYLIYLFIGLLTKEFLVVLCGLSWSHGLVPLVVMYGSSS
jgi:hypothetical protein